MLSPSGFEIHTYSKWTGTVRNNSVMRRGKVESCGRHYNFIINNGRVGNYLGNEGKDTST